jgi:tetratricopeptide (TPR) repeat protein
MFNRLYFLLSLLILSVVPAGAQQSADTQDARIPELFTRGYDTLQTNPAGAVPIFQEIIQLDSTNLLAQKQLGSLYLTLGRTEDALDRFVVANQLQQSDTTELQIAFLLNSLGRTWAAYRVFQALRKSEAPEIREMAEPATTILALMLCAERFPWWAKIQAYPLYDSRFNNYIFSASVYAGQYIDSSRIASVFGVASVTQDSRSEGGSLPIIFSDNVALAAAGIRLVPVRGLITDIQFGVAMGLIDRPDQERVRWDFRAVASYGNGIFPPVRMPRAITIRPSFLAELYSSFGYYTRYSNGIGYLQTKAGVRFLEWRYSALDLYLKGDAAIDTRGDFYNNIAEVAVGVRLIPNHWWGLAIALEYHRGVYWQSNQSTNPYNKYYDTVRIILLFDRFLCW